MDMYRGEYPGEDLDVIGDRMGIPRGIKNRNDLIKEQTVLINLYVMKVYLALSYQ